MRFWLFLALLLPAWAQGASYVGVGVNNTRCAPLDRWNDPWDVSGELSYTLAYERHPLVTPSLTIIGKVGDGCGGNPETDYTTGPSIGYVGYNVIADLSASLWSDGSAGVYASYGIIAWGAAYEDLVGAETPHKGINAYLGIGVWHSLTGPWSMRYYYSRNFDEAAPHMVIFGLSRRLGNN